MPTRNLPPQTGAGSARVIYGEYGADGGFSDAGATILVNPRPKGIWDHLDLMWNGLVGKRSSGRSVDPDEMTLAPSRTVTIAGAITTADERKLVVFNSGSPITITLPTLAAAGDGFEFYVLNIGAGTVTLDPDGSEQIAGASTVDLPTGMTWTIKASGATLGWRVLGRDAIARIPGVGAGNWIISTDAAGRVTGTVAVPDVSTIAQGRRQTVLFGPVDTSGRPSFLPATSVSLGITSQNISGSAPFVVHAANGAANRQGSRTTNLTWSGLTASRAAGTPNFLFVDVAADGSLTTGSTILAPTYREGGADVVTSGQATFNIAEMSMKVGNGSAAVQTWRVFVGEAATDGGAVISTVAYAYQGRSVTADQTVGAAASLQTHNHNLGIAPMRAEVFARCGVADLNYAIGDVVANPTTEGGGGGYAPFTVLIARNAASMRLGSSTALRLINNTTGGLNAATSASWALFVRADRGW